MRIFLLFLSILVVCNGVFSQKIISDPHVEKRDLHGFHAISVSYGIELILTQSDTEAVAVSAASVDDRDHILTKVENGVLKISYDYNLWKLWKDRNRKNKRLKAYVSVINLDKINGSSGALVKAEGQLKVRDILLHFSSGSRFDGQVEATDIKVDQSSGSKVSISGAAANIECTGSSGSGFYGYGMVVRNNCNARSSSGAKIEITVNGELSAHVSSGGHVYYKGQGVIRNIRSGSGGHVTKG
jgi:hypothetical protein